MGNIIKLNQESKKLCKGSKKAKEKITLGNDSGEVLEQVYAALGGVSGSVLYWRNREEQFRTLIEAKYLTKKAMELSGNNSANEVVQNVFATFIQNNGLQQPQQIESGNSGGAIEAQVIGALNSDADDSTAE